MKWLLIIWVLATQNSQIEQIGPFDSEQLCQVAGRQMIERTEQHWPAAKIETAICVRTAEDED